MYPFHFTSKIHALLYIAYFIGATDEFVTTKNVTNVFRWTNEEEKKTYKQCRENKETISQDIQYISSRFKLSKKVELSLLSWVPIFRLDCGRGKKHYDFQFVN